jgi:hypothetical protein
MRPPAAPSAPWTGSGGSPIAAAPAPGALGRLESSYQGSASGAATTAVISGMGALGAFIVGLQPNLSGWFIAAGFCLLVCISAWVSAASRANARVELFERGAIIKKGSSSDTFQFDNVKNVWYRGRQSSSGIPVTSRFSLELNTGRRVAIEATGFRNERDLATSLFRKLSSPLTVKALADLQAGKKLSFGAIQVDRFGVSNGRETIPWSEVSEVRVNNGTITINRQGKWLSWAQISTERTPNVLVLLMIADAIKGVRIP